MRKINKFTHVITIYISHAFGEHFILRTFKSIIVAADNFQLEITFSQGFKDEC